MTARPIRGVAALIVVLVLGCAEINVTTDYDPNEDFSGLRTWSWLSLQPGKAEGDLRTENPLLHRRIQNAIEQQLWVRGYRQLSQGQPDFYVNYLIAVEQRFRADPAYGGAGFDTTGLGAPAVYVQSYDVGTLIIDVIDAKRRALVWRGTAQSRVNELHDPEKRAERVRNAVAKILERFPPSTG